MEEAKATTKPQKLQTKQTPKPNPKETNKKT